MYQHLAHISFALDLASLCFSNATTFTGEVITSYHIATSNLSVNFKRLYKLLNGRYP